MNIIKVVLEYIAKSNVYGIPLDIIAHFVLGALIYYASALVLKSKLKATIFILALAILKETFDWGVIMRNNLFFEPIKDIVVTMLGAWLIYSVQKIHLRLISHR